MKKLFLFLTAFLAVMQLSAADVSTSQAQAAANAFLNKQVATGHIKAAAASNLRLVKAEKSVARPTAVDYYIFNSAQSYVVVAGDDLAPQILMYGEEGSLDINNIPPAMQWLLNKYKYQIDGLKAGTLAPIKLPKFATTPVAPLVLANWDQSAPYNNQCPTSGGSRAVTGCPATSLAMCYYKWKWPETYPAVAALSGTGGISAAALDEREADWDNIIDEYTGPTNYSSTTAQKNAVAWLMRYAGQSIPDYYYSTSASGANDPEILQGCQNMGYTDAQLLTLTELVQSGWSVGNGSQRYTDAQWNEWMLNELYNGRPIEYLAYDSKNSDHAGHAFNVFGVNASGQYYVNWGWSGDSNGYCTLHNFTTATGATGGSGSYIFSWGEAMIIGIEPPAGALTTPKITVNPSTLAMNTTVGTPTTATFTVTGANLTSNVNLSVRGDNAFSLSTTNISASQAEGGVTVTVTYNPSAVGTHEATVTLASTDADDVTVKLNGTAEAAPLVTYPPVMLDATNITSTSFTATWTDQTPAENVESYTLYVQDASIPITPEIALLDTTDWSADNTIPTGWTQYNLKYFSSTSACYLSTNGYVQSKTYDLTGYDKVTVVVYSQPYDQSSVNSVTVETSVDSKTITETNGSGFNWYTFVLDCASSDYVKLTSVGMPDLRYMKVYAGDLTATQLKATETGDETYRVITGITGKSYTVTGLAEAGTYNFYVVANYVNSEIGTSNVNQVTLLENTNPVLAVNPAALDMTATVGESATATFNVSGAYLTGDVTLTLTDENGVYSIAPTTISAADVMSGKDVTVAYAPTAYGSHNATITLSSADAADVTVTLTGTATLRKEVPVMLPADEAYINLTQFRADWTDATPDANVASYTLEVTPKPTTPEIPDPVLLEDADFTNLSAVTNTSDQLTNVASSASDYLPADWTAQTGLWINQGYIISGYLSGYTCGITSKAYDFTGYDKVTVVMSAYTYYADYYGTATIRVKTSAGSQEIALATDDFTTYTVVLDVAENDQIVFEGVENMFAIEDIKIYAGDLNAVNTLRMLQETGDENYRLIEGITPDKFYLVQDLTAGGTFLYRVKAVYIDNTESEWSNIEEVTLFENGHGFQPGDLDHSGAVNTKDLSMLINYLLTNDGDAVCMICADVNGDGLVNTQDIAALIGLLINGPASTRMLMW